MLGRAGAGAAAGAWVGAATAAGAVVLGVVVPATPGAAAVSAPSALSAPSPLRVDVSGDVRDAKPGDVITYTVHVRNLSGSRFPHVRVAHRLPAGFRVVGSTPRAAKGAAGPEWTVALAPGQAVVFSDTARAGTVAQAEKLDPKPRSAAASHTFTTTACVLDGTGRATIACGDASQALADAAPAAGAPAKHGWQPGLVGIGLLAAGYGAVRSRVRGWKQRHGRA